MQILPMHQAKQNETLLQLWQVCNETRSPLSMDWRMCGGNESFHVCHVSLCTYFTSCNDLICSKLFVYYKRFSNRYIFINTMTRRRIRSVQSMVCICCGQYSWSCIFCLLVGCLCSIFILYWRMWLPVSWRVEKNVRI